VDEGGDSIGINTATISLRSPVPQRRPAAHDMVNKKIVQIGHASPSPEEPYKVH
jgi:hypothetical protein